jgi:hypothetical protein
VTTVLLILVRIPLVDGINQLLQLILIITLDLRQRQDSGGLLVHDGAEAGLALDDRVGDAHLAAKRRQEDDELDGVNVVGDEDEGGLLVLDEAHDVVEAILDGVGLLGGVFLLLALGDGGGFGLEALLLLGLGLWAVLVEQLEGLRGGVAVEGCGELGDRGGDLQAHVQDLALALEADVLGPAGAWLEGKGMVVGDASVPDHTGEVAWRLDILTDAEVAGPLLDERVLLSSACLRVDFAHHYRWAGG